MNLLFGRERRPDNLNGSKQREISSHCRNRYTTSSAAASRIMSAARARRKQVRWERKSSQNFRSAIFLGFLGPKWVRGNQRQRQDDCCMRQERYALRAARIRRAAKPQRMQRCAIRGTHLPFPGSQSIAKVSADALNQVVSGTH